MWVMRRLDLVECPLDKVHRLPSRWRQSVRCGNSQAESTDKVRSVCTYVCLRACVGVGAHERVHERICV